MSILDQAPHREPHWAPEYWPVRLTPPTAEETSWSPWYRLTGSGAKYDLEKFELQFCGPNGLLQLTAENSTAFRYRPKTSTEAPKDRPDFKTKQHGEVTVTTSSGQQWLKLGTCPRGSKVQLMFRFGLPRYEVYHGQPDALAWAPMPDSPAWLKDELSNQNRS